MILRVSKVCLQAGLRDMHNKHEGEVRMLKKQLRSTRAEVVQLTDEVRDDLS